MEKTANETNAKIEAIKKSLPAETPFLNICKINGLLANSEITEKEATELYDWNLWGDK